MNRIKLIVMGWAKLTGAALVVSLVVGTVLDLLFKWPLLQGIYVMCFVFSIFAMLYASMMFVGTPQMRYDYLVRGKKLRRQGKGHEVEAMEDKGVVPALVAVTLIFLGFAIEAALHL